MVEKHIKAVILAAGKGTRMRSDLPKVLHTLLGKPLIAHVLETVLSLGLSPIVVLGHQAEAVKQVICEKEVSIVIQKEQLGTGHALQCCWEFLKDFDGSVLVLNGDVPLISQQTISELIRLQQTSQAAIALVTAKVSDAQAYGTIVRDEKSRIKGICEITDRQNQMAEAEINAGIYCFETQFLKQYLFSLTKHPQKGEYYLTELISLAYQAGKKIISLEVPFDEVIGINTRKDLALATAILQKKIIDKLMLEGITVVSPDRVYIETDVKVGLDTVISPGVSLKGKTTIGKGCILEEGVVVVDSQIGDRVHLKPYCVITESHIESETSIGPFAHLRPKSHIGPKARIGNFVEVKKSFVGAGSKASHLTYLGDSHIGANVNIGAGTITCNYDGKRKHQTIIEDGAFIGSNTALVAPVKVGTNALIGAGSVITEDVPPDTLAIARARQVHKPKKRD